jgi:hypothetical protein
MRPLVVLAVLAVLASVAWAGDPAMADPKAPAAHERFARGNRLYRIRKFEEAIVEYQAGAVIELAPVFDYNLGQCYRQLGKYTDAIWHYERFLKNVSPGSELHALVTGFLQQMGGELERRAMTQPPTDAAQETASEAEVLRRRRRAGARRDPAPAPGTEPSTAIGAHGEPRWYSDSIGWGLTGGGVLGGGVAAYLLTSASGLRASADRTPDEERRLGLRDTSHTRSIAGAALGIGSVGLIAIGVIKLAIRSGRPTTTSTASWRLGAGYRGAVVLWRF